MDNLGVAFLSEVVGTALLVLLGCGVVANVALAKNKGLGGGFLMVNIGWGLAVFAGVIVAYASGAHLNPAVTLGLAVTRKFQARFGQLQQVVDGREQLAIVPRLGEVIGRPGLHQIDRRL